MILYNDKDLGVIVPMLEGTATPALHRALDHMGITPNVGDEIALWNWKTAHLELYYYLPFEGHSKWWKSQGVWIYAEGQALFYVEYVQFPDGLTHMCICREHYSARTLDIAILPVHLLWLSSDRKRTSLLLDDKEQVAYFEEHMPLDGWME